MESPPELNRYTKFTQKSLFVKLFSGIKYKISRSFYIKTPAGLLLSLFKFNNVQNETLSVRNFGP